MENRGILCSRAPSILQFDKSFRKKCLISRGSCKNGISDVAYTQRNTMNSISVLAYLVMVRKKKKKKWISLIHTKNIKGVECEKDSTWSINIAQADDALWTVAFLIHCSSDE